MPGIGIIFFDYGNVLSLSQSVSLRSEMQKLSGLDGETFESRYSRYRRPYDSGLIPAEEYWRRILDDPGGRIGRDRIEALIELDMKSWEEVDEEMIEIARSLKERGLTVGILSNMPVVMDRYLEATKEWYGLFEPRVISGHIRTAKPEPEIYAYAERAAGTRPEEIIFIDDMEENVRAAAEAGFRVHHYAGAASLVRFLEDELDGVP